ncbi:hypothetical protein SeMB42_g07531, partial [Synchytrium endobioticum]
MPAAAPPATSNAATIASRVRRYSESVGTSLVSGLTDLWRKSSHLHALTLVHPEPALLIPKVESPTASSPTSTTAVPTPLPLPLPLPLRAPVALPMHCRPSQNDASVDYKDGHSILTPIASPRPDSAVGPKDNPTCATSHARRKDALHLPAPIMITPPITPRITIPDLHGPRHSCARADLFAERGVLDHIPMKRVASPCNALQSIGIPRTVAIVNSPIEDFSQHDILVAVNKLDELLCPESPDSPSTPSVESNPNGTPVTVYKRSFLCVSTTAYHSDSTSPTTSSPSSPEPLTAAANSSDPPTPTAKQPSKQELLARTDQFGFVHSTSSNADAMTSATAKDISRSLKWKSMASSIAPDPALDTTNKHHSRYSFPITSDKFIRRCFKGIPHEWRAHAWFQMITSSSGLYLNLDSPQQIQLEVQWLHEYHAFQTDGNHTSHDYAIGLDIPRTFPNHISFMNANEQGQQCLFRVIKGLSNKYPEIGYVQGMCLLGATLLLVMTEEMAYISLVHLFSPDTSAGKNPYRLHALYSPGFPLLIETDHLIGHLMNIYCARTRDRLASLGIDTKIFTTKWIVTLFVGCCNLNPARSASHVMD